MRLLWDALHAALLEAKFDETFHGAHVPVILWRGSFDAYERLGRAAPAGTDFVTPFVALQYIAKRKSRFRAYALHGEVFGVLQIDLRSERNKRSPRCVTASIKSLALVRWGLQWHVGPRHGGRGDDLLHRGTEARSYVDTVAPYRTWKTKLLEKMGHQRKLRKHTQLLK